MREKIRWSVAARGVAALVVALSATGPALGQSTTKKDSELLQTDWMEFVKGYRDEASGLQVREVIRDEQTGGMQVQIAVPKVSMSGVSDMEEVRVVGQRPQEIDLKKWLPQFEYEWVDDYDNEHYGLLVRFKENQRLPLRLFFSSDSGFLQPQP
jgi:hypothetical protein